MTPLPCRIGRPKRPAKAEAVHRIDQLLHSDLALIKRDARLLIPEAHFRLLHALEPLQGPLDRNRSSASGHTLDSQHDGRGGNRRSLRQPEHEDDGHPRNNRAPHSVTDLFMLFMSCPADSCVGPSVR